LPISEKPEFLFAIQTKTIESKKANSMKVRTDRIKGMKLINLGLVFIGFFVMVFFFLSFSWVFHKKKNMNNFYCLDLKNWARKENNNKLRFIKLILFRCFIELKKNVFSLVFHQFFRAFLSLSFFRKGFSLFKNPLFA